MMSFKGLDTGPNRRNALMVLWCLVILVVGVAAGRAIETGSRTAIGIAAMIVAVAILLAVFATHINLFYGVAFATVPMTSVIVPGAKLPLNELMLTIALIVCIVQNRGHRDRLPAFPKIAAAVLLGMMTISTALNGGFDLNAMKRLGHLALFCGVFLAIAAGMLPRRIIQKGILIGISLASITGVIYLAIGYAPRGYEGRLTGLLFGDPNPAAVAILVLGFLSIEIVPAGWRRNGVIALFAVPFLLTQSRGALVAVFLCLVWWFLGRRLRPSAGLAVLGGSIAVVSIMPATIQNSGVFASRAGSDVLRSTILSKSLAAAGEGFWLGNGPGNTRLDVYGQYQFYFHNSFLAVIAEGGILSAIAIVVLIILTFIRMISLPPLVRNPWFEMALIAVLATAFHLGEVLLDLPSAIAIGFCLTWIVRPESEPDSGLFASSRRIRPGLARVP